MQFTLTINQEKALEWGLNTQQAILFSFIYSCPSWCNPVKTADGVFYAISKAKIVKELPLLTDKPDTAYRILKQLQTAGVIEISSTPKITLIRLTEKAKDWNRKVESSEINPSKVGKKSEQGRKKIRGTSDKNPTNHITSNHYTSNQSISRESTAAEPASAAANATDSASFAVAKPPKSSRLKITDLPDDWREWAKQRRPDLDPDETWEQFRDYWIAVPGQKGTKNDWLATWRNWNRNQRQKGNNSNAAHQPTRQYQDKQDRIRQINKELLEAALRHPMD